MTGLKKMTTALLVLAGGAGAADPTTPCPGIADNTERLACYDAAAGRAQQEAPPPPPVREANAFSARWELDAEDKHGTFLIQPYKPTYILPVRWSNSTNPQPSSPNPANSQVSPTEVNAAEAKYQLSFKTKLWEGLFARHGDLWVGYTQQSSWQVYNQSNSAPFRETDYEPEIMAVFRTNLDAGAGFRVKMMALGLDHQSNGRTAPLSRSWNRAIAQVGVERDNFALFLRPWYRFPESAGQDDNPDIGHYLGHGDALALWRVADQTVGLTLRSALFSGRGSANLDWSIPIHRHLKGYLQLFTGYGETLIDYNHRQTTFGFGVSLVDWM
jgi:phospholipase A1